MLVEVHAGGSGGVLTGSGALCLEILGMSCLLSCLFVHHTCTSGVLRRALTKQYDVRLSLYEVQKHCGGHMH